MYLPVILYTPHGLVYFSSKEFHLNDDGSVVVEKAGMRFAKAHGKIYYAAEEAVHGSYVHHEKNEKGKEVVTNTRPLDFLLPKTSLQFSFPLRYCLLFS